MKISIEPELVSKLKKLMVKVHSSNPYAVKSLSAFGAAALLELVESISDAQFLSLANRSTTKKGKEKSLLEMVKSIMASADEETLKNIEKTLKKLEQPKTKISQNSS